MQREDEDPRRYEAGESVLEPAGRQMARFDNASTTKPAILIATYLASESDGELITFPNR